MPAFTTACTVAAPSSRVVGPQPWPVPLPPRVQALLSPSLPKVLCCIGVSLYHPSAISGDLLSAVISTRYILVFRKDNPNVFNSLIQNWPRFQRHKIHMLLILLALCLRKPNGISHLLSMAYAIAGNGCFKDQHWRKASFALAARIDKTNVVS